jgi:hypothetical protein
MAANGIFFLEPGVICLTDNDGRLWFNKIDEVISIDESLSDAKVACEVVKIRQTELTTLESLREDVLFINVL